MRRRERCVASYVHNSKRALVFPNTLGMCSPCLLSRPDALSLWASPAGRAAMLPSDRAQPCLRQLLLPTDTLMVLLHAQQACIRECHLTRSARSAAPPL